MSESVANHPNGQLILDPACAAIAYMLNHACFAADRPHVKAWTASAVADLALIWQGLSTTIPGLSLADVARCVMVAGRSAEAGSLPMGGIDPGEALQQIGYESYAGREPRFCSLPAFAPLIRQAIAIGWPVACALKEIPGECSWVGEPAYDLNGITGEKAVYEGNVVMLLGWNDDAQHYVCRRMDMAIDDPHGWETVSYSLWIDPCNVMELVILAEIKCP